MPSFPMGDLPMFKKILVPLDGSELASSILPQVAELAKKFQAEVTLIHVSPGEEEDMAGASGSTAADVRKACEAYIGILAKDLQRQGLKIDVACINGNPAREIIRYAGEHRVDLIAMASHGSGELAWLLGSVANKVLTHTDKQVLLYRVLESELPSPKGKEKRFI